MTADDSNAHRKGKRPFHAELKKDREKLMNRAKRIMGVETDPDLLNGLVDHYLERRRGMNRQMEREEKQLGKDLDAGLITEKEYHEYLRDMYADFEQAARDRAEQVYNDEMGYF